jgi:hypothetical protein
VPNLGVCRCVGSCHKPLGLRTAVRRHRRRSGREPGAVSRAGLCCPGNSTRPNAGYVSDPNATDFFRRGRLRRSTTPREVKHARFLAADRLEYLAEVAYYSEIEGGLGLRFTDAEASARESPQVPRAPGPTGGCRAERRVPETMMRELGATSSDAMMATITHRINRWEPVPAA